MKQKNNIFFQIFYYSWGMLFKILVLGVFMFLFLLPLLFGFLIFIQNFILFIFSP
jgi:hypothetical protein